MLDIPYTIIPREDGTISVKMHRDASRIDLLDAVAVSGFGLSDIDEPSGDAYRWRWVCDEIVQALTEDAAREVLEFIARAYDVDVEWIER